MQKSQSQPSGATFGIHDIIYVIFKHKWKILLLSLLGFAAAYIFQKNQEPVYSSTAKLLVKYVIVRDEENTLQPGTRYGSGYVLDTELEILKSTDLTLAVAESLGVAKILPKYPLASLADAAGTVSNGMEIFVTPGSNVIHINYSNSEKQLSTLILKEIVRQYFLKHLQIHRSPAAFELVAKQVEEARTKLKETETELDALRSQSGIISLAEATGFLTDQRTKTQGNLMEARADLAEAEASIKSFAASASAQESKDSKTPKTKADPPQALPAGALSEYKAILNLIDVLQKREMELKLKFKPGNRLLELSQSQLADYESRRQAMISRYPSLTSELVASEPNDRGAPSSYADSQARLEAVKARVRVHTAHLEEIKEQFKEQYAIGAKVDVLVRDKQMEESEYRSLESNLKNAKVDLTLDPSRMPNIDIVQNPSEPLKAFPKSTQKIVLALAGGGMALGVGLAFLIELLFDRRVKRPIEILTRLQLPLMLSIPLIRNRDRGGFMISNGSAPARLGTGHSDPDESLSMPERDRATLGKERKASHFILPYSETIRDRMIFNFEMNNIVHKPKLVAVTGLSAGAGASTIAAGLAKSFSEIKGCKVLLVDLSSFHPEESPLFGELPRQSLNAALQIANKSDFKQSKQNLFYASALARRDESGLSTFTPMQLFELLPKLQASDYDYIIFDMPTIDQTSRTLTMAGLMDKVLLVLDAENTSRDSLKWGYSELVKGKADVSCVFNKTRNHAPSWLIGDN